MRRPLGRRASRSTKDLLSATNGGIDRVFVSRVAFWASIVSNFHVGVRLGARASF